MRILCPTCKLLRERNDIACILHGNPDKQKYYCFCEGEVTNQEWARELKMENDKNP